MTKSHTTDAQRQTGLPRVWGEFAVAENWDIYVAWNAEEERMEGSEDGACTGESGVDDLD